MVFDEDDIAFADLSGEEFEELCFDLLHRLGFHSLEWRQGGADQGRDIEAALTVTNPLTGEYTENWFIECKNKARGVSVADLTEKIAWTDAERPAHFLIATSTYLTNNARHWLKQIGATKPYRIHSVEGKKLKRITLSFADIAKRYFIDRYRRLLQDGIRRWAVSEVLPSPQELYLFSRNLKAEKLDLRTAAFLWLSHEISRDSVAEWCEENDIDDFDIEGLGERLVSSAIQSKTPVLKEYESVRICDYGSRLFGYTYDIVDGELVGPGRIVIDDPALRKRKEEIVGTHMSRQVTAQLLVSTGRQLNGALYCYTFNAKHSMFLEVLLVDDLQEGVKIRAVGIDSDFADDQVRAMSYLDGRTSRSIEAGA